MPELPNSHQCGQRKVLHHIQQICALRKSPTMRDNPLPYRSDGMTKLPLRQPRLCRDKAPNSTSRHLAIPTYRVKQSSGGSALRPQPSREFSIPNLDPKAVPYAAVAQQPQRFSVSHGSAVATRQKARTHDVKVPTDLKKPKDLSPRPKGFTVSDGFAVATQSSKPRQLNRTNHKHINTKYARQQH